jgi:hypothetical protein
MGRLRLGLLQSRAFPRYDAKPKIIYFSATVDKLSMKFSGDLTLPTDYRSEFFRKNLFQEFSKKGS